MATSQNTASLKIRPAEMADAEKCGDILYRAFQTIADHHNFFVQRLRAAGPSKGIIYKRSGNFRGFEGMRLRPLRATTLAARMDAG